LWQKKKRKEKNIRHKAVKLEWQLELEIAILRKGQENNMEPDLVIVTSLSPEFLLHEENKPLQAHMVPLVEF
jgi:hypothetical protein